MSTKIPQYMATGRPILAYGPDEAASYRYINEQGCGIVVGSQEFSELLEASRRLSQSLDIRQELGLRGWEIAAQRHSAPKVREQFRNVINEAVRLDEVQKT
jgi:hypothetical protein